MPNSLVCITTASRPSALKAMVWNYLRFANTNPEFKFLVSLDGQDDRSSAFCRKFGIPLLVSEKSEGVGISKNRVLSTYPDFDFYFFIEDDAELLQPAVFEIHIRVHKFLGLHHMSLGPPSRFLEKSGELDSEYGAVDLYCFGSGQFNFFSREGIRAVGGFHPEFAEYRRFGHTEHSYRFVNSGLAPAPFCVIRRCLRGYFSWHEPRSVRRMRIATVKSRLSLPETALIEQKLKHYPITTPSDFVSPASLVQNTRISRLHEMVFRLIFGTYLAALIIVRRMVKLIRRTQIGGPD